MNRSSREKCERIYRLQLAVPAKRKAFDVNSMVHNMFVDARVSFESTELLIAGARLLITELTRPTILPIASAVSSETKQSRTHPFE